MFEKKREKMLGNELKLNGLIFSFKNATLKQQICLPSCSIAIIIKLEKLKNNNFFSFQTTI